MVFKRKRWWFLSAWAACFVTGFFAWKVLHTGSFVYHDNQDVESIDDLDLSVYVGDYLVTRADIEWEYNFYILQLKNGSDAQHSEGKEEHSEPSKIGLVEPNPSKKPNVELYNKIMGNLIERKLLYQYVSLDKKFSIEEPSRYTNCLKQWQAAMKEQAAFFNDDKARAQLKSMLCEKNILEQYVQERLVAPIKISDAELQTYFQNHKSDFQEAVHVTVRHVLLPSEAEAKKVRARINKQNFASIAKETSIAPEAVEGGKLGPFAKGEMPSLFDVAFEMSPGEIQGILKSTYGFHIIMLEKKSPRLQPNFEVAREKIMQILNKKRQDEEYQKWVEMALNNIPVRSSRSL